MTEIEGKGYIIAVIGHSAAGKDSFVYYLKENSDLEYLTQYTTRPPRPDEITPRCIFEDEDTYMQRKNNGEIAESSSHTIMVDGAKKTVRYYTLKKDYNTDANKIIACDPQRIQDIAYILYEQGRPHCIIPVFIYASEAMRLYRSVQRAGQNKDLLENILMRMKDFAEMMNSMYYRYIKDDGFGIIIDNDEFAFGSYILMKTDRALYQIDNIINQREEMIKNGNTIEIPSWLLDLRMV